MKWFMSHQDPSDGKVLVVREGADKHLTVIAEVVVKDGDAENARLIAAAPELLAFAMLVKDFFYNDSAGHAVYLKEQAQKVIRATE